MSKTSASNVKISDTCSTSAVFMNTSRHEYTRIKFDGCVLKGVTACDWIVEKAGVGRLAVELKGSDVDRAAEQVAAALQFMREHQMSDLRVGGLIVCSRYPSVDTKVQRIKQRLAKEFRAPLTVRTNGRNLVFETLLSFSD